MKLEKKFILFLDFLPQTISAFIEKLWDGDGVIHKLISPFSKFYVDPFSSFLVSDPHCEVISMVAYEVLQSITPPKASCLQLKRKVQPTFRAKTFQKSTHPKVNENFPFTLLFVFPILFL